MLKLPISQNGIYLPISAALLWFPPLKLWNFHQRSPIYFLKLHINISFLSEWKWYCFNFQFLCQLLVYWNTPDFCVWILYPATLLKWLILVTFLDSLGFSLQTIMSSAIGLVLLLYFPTLNSWFLPHFVLQDFLYYVE